MSEKIHVEIVAPVHNRRDITLLCLRSLSRIRRENLVVHTIIVDDGSTDCTSEAIRKDFPDVEIIEADGSLWFTEGTNVGVRAALKHDPKYILMMNDDQIFDADFLENLVETAEKIPRSVVGALLLLWETPHKIFQIAPEWQTFNGGWRHWYQQTVWSVPAKPWKVDLIVGNCLLVPVAAIEECGLMNSKRFPNFGDAEYTPRLKKKGWNLLIDPRARVFCQPNNLPLRVKKMSPREKINALLFDLKHIHNLRRRFYAHWDGAPSRIKGLAGFGIFIIRGIFKKNTETMEWANEQREKPLREYFASAVIDE